MSDLVGNSEDWFSHIAAQLNSINQLYQSLCLLFIHLSHRVRKPMWFPNRSDPNQAVQSQKQASSLKFRIYVAKTKALICVFVFAYANCWFSHEVAHMFLTFK